jgi:glutamate synthase (NADPH/NADH) small chain
LVSRTKRSIGENGHVKTLVCNEMELGVPDTSGRRKPLDTGRTFTLEVDMIIKAAGQMPFKDLVDSYSLQNTNGKIIVKHNGSNIEGVFAGGDCVNGGKEVVGCRAGWKRRCKSYT